LDGNEADGTPKVREPWFCSGGDDEVWCSGEGPGFRSGTPGEVESWISELASTTIGAALSLTGVDTEVTLA
jgi:hypothetical protein